MTESTSKQIFENSKYLLTTCLQLKELGNYLHASHFAALTLEEATKCLMHIDEISNLFSQKEKFSHATKEKLSYVFHYINGGLAVIYSMKVAKDNGFLGGTAIEQSRVFEHFLKFVGVSDKYALIEVIKKYVEDVSKKINHTKSNSIIDSIRKHSVYSDFYEGKLHLPRDRVTNESMDDIINNATFAIELLKMIFDESFDFSKYVEILPPKYKVELELRVDEMIKYVENTGKSS
jgi:AbiV family abortive infection protein